MHKNLGDGWRKEDPPCAWKMQPAQGILLLCTESRVGGESAATTAQGTTQKESVFSVFRKTKGD